jgi:hypothetical protein
LNAFQVDRITQLALDNGLEVIGQKHLIGWGPKQQNEGKNEQKDSYQPV